MLISILVFEMPLFDVALKMTRSKGESTFIDLTRRFPSASVFIWCNRENDVIEIVVRNPEEYSLVIKEIHAQRARIKDIMKKLLMNTDSI
jgi:hypothetical protein